MRREPIVTITHSLKLCSFTVKNRMRREPIVTLSPFVKLLSYRVKNRMRREPINWLHDCMFGWLDDWMNEARADCDKYI